jgi:uncharacterized protein YgbK (DUF1537 family)
MNGQAGTLVVLDDDPTGTQAVADVPVLLDWDADLVARSARGRPSLHLLTNSRALPPERAREVVRDGAETAVAALGRPRLWLRGDSTLRAHLLEEYLAVRDAGYPGRTPPLLLVPALPHPLAGRITVDGTHMIERNGVRVPLHETEYARDASFAYRDARLLQWAEDRSGGFFPVEAGREVRLGRLRSEGADALAATLLELAEAGTPAVCVPDAVSLADLETIADGLRRAEAAGGDVIVRSAPTFVGVFAGNLASAKVAPPPADGALLVVCGSYVSTTTRQLAALAEAYPGCVVEVDVLALASADAEPEIARAAAQTSRVLAHAGTAVVATPRVRPESTHSLDAGERIAHNLARVVAAVRPAPAVVLAKGGITSAVVAREGLGARSALALGPLVDGVAVWRLDAPGGKAIPYVVFPGNVGDDRTLLEVVELLRAAP